MNFQVELAEKVVEIHSIYDRIYPFCENYILPSHRSPDIIIESCIKDIEREKDHYSKRNRIPKNDLITKPEMLECTAVYRKIASCMPAFDTFMMHGAVVSTRGEGFIITAPSGTGKTSRARLWLETIPDSIVVNGDKPLIKITDDISYAFGTPWCGKEGWNTNTSVPVRAVLFLERSETETHVSELDFSAVFTRLIQQSFLPENMESRRKVLQLIRKMNGKTRMILFQCPLNGEGVRKAWEYLYSAKM